MFENDFPALLHSGPAPGKYYRPFYGFSSMVEYQTLNHEVCGLKSLSCLCNSFSTKSPKPQMLSCMRHHCARDIFVGNMP